MSRPTTDADGRAGGREGGTAFCHVSVAPLSPNRGYHVTKGGGGRGGNEIKKHYATVGYLVFGHTVFLQDICFSDMRLCSVSCPKI